MVDLLLKLLFLFVAQSKALDDVSHGFLFGSLFALHLKVLRVFSLYKLLGQLDLVESDLGRGWDLGLFILGLFESPHVIIIMRELLKEAVMEV